MTDRRTMNPDLVEPRPRRRTIASLALLGLLLGLAGTSTLLPASANAAPAASAPAAALTGAARPSALAGQWYPDEAATILVEVQRHLRAAANAPAIKGKPIALITPHAGWRYSGPAAATAFRLLKEGDFSRVVVVAPSHHTSFSGFALDDASAYQTPLGEIPLSADGVAALRDESLARKVPGSTEREHAVEIELPFLQATLRRFDLVPVLAGQTNPEQERAFAKRLAALNDGRTLYVFSSDFTHYGPRFGYSPFGETLGAHDRIRELNSKAIEKLVRIDAPGFRAHYNNTGNSICGHAGLGVLMELLPLIAPKATGVLLDHYASQDIQGMNDDSSISYVAIAYTSEPPPATPPLSAPPAYEPITPETPPLSEAIGDRLVRLARAALRTQLAGGADLYQELARFPAGDEFERLQGFFVTLNRKNPAEIAAEGKLRGCVGTIFPAYPIYQAVVEAAVSAALKDRRFRPVQAGELDRLEVEVTALSVPKPIASWKEIKIGTHGIVLQKGERRALFLPQVAPEQGWTLEETLDALSRKAGLPPGAWREGAQFSVFTGQVFQEKHST